ncbi:hypothetical protein [Propionivibrio dicarboxylicus]|nr:hypothetical protein [Propionivibrio dicarboxylicus]
MNLPQKLLEAEILDKLIYEKCEEESRFVQNMPSGSVREHIRQLENIKNAISNFLMESRLSLMAEKKGTM